MERLSNDHNLTRRPERTGAGARRQASNVSTGSAPAPVRETGSGPVRGDRLNGVARFLGIPYAQSIAGRNRFAPPRPVEPWTGVREARHYAPSSPQQEVAFQTPVSPAFQPPDYVTPGDDCLALNVWAPEAEDGNHPDGNHPVMVWLHGGGWTSESASGQVYDGANLAGRGDVVVVSVNHRLGLSGYTDFSRVAGGDFADSANLGMRDIVAALEWVRDNIATFGGDPDNVTIFGESGGGWKVATTLGMPSAKSLFHRAIIESGPLTRVLTPAEADDLARAVLSELGLTTATAGGLNDVSLDEIVAAEGRILAKTPMSMQSPGFPMGFWPVMDGEVIPAHIFDPVAAPTSLDVPLLIGQNGTEFSTPCPAPGSNSHGAEYRRHRASPTGHRTRRNVERACISTPPVGLHRMWTQP